MKCSLSEDINNCPFYNKEFMSCNNNNNKCAFWIEKICNEKQKYIRKERWYEKYYKDVGRK